MATEIETKDDEKFHDDLAADISKDMDKNFNPTNTLPQWTYITDYDQLQFDQWMHPSFISCTNDILVVYNRRFEEKAQFQGLHIYDITKNEWRKSADIYTDCTSDQQILVVNSALYNKKSHKLSIIDQCSHSIIQYDLNNHSWNSYKNTRKSNCSTGKVSGRGLNDIGPIRFSWTDNNAIVLDEKQNKLYIFKFYIGIKSYESDYFSSKNKETTDGTQGIEIMNNQNNCGLQFSAITQLIFIQNKQCIYVFGETGYKLYKYLIKHKQWSVVILNIDLPYKHMRCMKDENEKYIIFYSGWYNKSPYWGYGIQDTPNTKIYIFDINTEKMYESKINAPFTHKDINANYYCAIIIKQFIYVMSRKGSLYKIKLDSIVSLKYNEHENALNKYFKIVKEIDMKRMERTLDITKYNYQITSYVLLICFFDYSDAGWEMWRQYNMSLAPPYDPDIEQKDPNICNHGIIDPFHGIYNKWKLYNDNEKMEKYKQIINVLYNVQRKAGKKMLNELDEKYKLNGFGIDYRKLNRFERKLVLYKFFEFIGNDLIRLNIDGIKENEKEEKKEYDNDKYVMTFELYGIDYNNCDMIKDINTLINGIWSKYKIYQIEPWPTFNINNVNLCNKYKFHCTVGIGRTSRVIKAIPIDDNNHDVAIKIISKKFKNSELIYKNEVNILSNIKHKNIVPFIENAEDDLNYYIITKLYEGFELPKRCKENYYQVENLKVWLKHILLMTQFLHSKNIIIRDLKFEDFIETETGSSIILFDLGYAQYISDNIKYNKDIIDISIKYSHYIAPELILNITDKINSKLLKCCDIWNIGIICYMMLTGKAPFKDSIKDELILPEKELATDNVLPIALIHLLKRLLNKDVKKRISIEDALNHPFFIGGYLAPEPWIQLKKCQYDLVSKRNVIPYLFTVNTMNNKYIILYNYFVGFFDDFFDRKCKTLHGGFFIYDISKNEWYKSSEIPMKTEQSIREDNRGNTNKYKLITKICSNTLIYNNKTNILTMYEYQLEKLIEYNLNINNINSSIWNVNKYKQRFIYDHETKLSNAYEFEFKNGCEQCVVVNDKIHIFSMGYDNNTYKHWIMNYFNDNNQQKRIDVTQNDKFNISNKEIEHPQYGTKMKLKLQQFTSMTHILYCKIEQCLFIIYYEFPKMFKYSLLTKTWNVIKNISIGLKNIKAFLCRNDEYILMYGANGSYGNSLTSRDIYLFNTNSEIMTQSKNKSPFEDSSNHAPDRHKYVAINVDQSIENDKLLLNGYIRLFCNKKLIPKNISNLINSFVSREYIYMLSMKFGNICKIDLSQLENSNQINKIIEK